jgi:hypothetical protein
MFPSYLKPARDIKRLKDNESSQLILKRVTAQHDLTKLEVERRGKERRVIVGRKN